MKKIDIIGVVGIILALLTFMGYSSYKDFKNKELIIYANILNNDTRFNKDDNYQEISFSLLNEFDLIKDKSIIIYLDSKNEKGISLIADYYDRINNKINISKISNGFKLDFKLFKNNQEYKFSILAPSNYSYKDFKVKGTISDDVLLSSEISKQKTYFRLEYAFYGIILILIFILFFFIKLKAEKKNEKEKCNGELNILNNKIIDMNNQCEEKKIIYKTIINEKNKDLENIYSRNKDLENEHKKYVEDLKEQMFAIQKKLLENMGR